jgi:DNA-directed RNA polymerase-4 subunit 1
MKLPATVLSPYFIEEVARLLNQICPGCHTPKQNRDSKVCAKPDWPSFILIKQFILFCKKKW